MHLPWTIWRQTTLELWRLLALTATVLVTVISFAASVLLAAQGKLDPLDTIKYMFLIMPPMLQFALPFAAGFAATLSYHRMSQDNELTAAAAGGVSHRTLLVPALVSGLVLAGLMSLLLDEIAPRFYGQIERVVAKDAARLVIAPIEAGRPLMLSGTLVHADKVHTLGPNKEHGAFQTLLLTGVMALDLDKQGKVRREVAASQAIAEFSLRSDDPGQGRGEPGPVGQTTGVGLRMIDPLIFVPEEGITSARAHSMTLQAMLPSTFEDNPKFRTTRQLLELPDYPDRLRFVDAKRRELVLHLGERDATDAIGRALAQDGSATLRDADSREITIRASGLEWRKDRWELTRSGKPIEVTVTARGASLYLSARTAGLRSSLGSELGRRRLTFKLELESLISRVRPGDSGTEFKEQAFGELVPDPDPVLPLTNLASPQLLTEAERRAERAPQDAFVNQPAQDLRATLAKVGREIVSKYHERWASAIASLFMVLAGALTAMRLSASLPLTVYLWSFFPALFTVITISAGQQMAHKVGPFGLGLLWSGVGALAAYCVGAFVVVRKH